MMFAKHGVFAPWDQPLKDFKAGDASHTTWSSLPWHAKCCCVAVTCNNLAAYLRWANDVERQQDEIMSEDSMREYQPDNPSHAVHVIGTALIEQCVPTGSDKNTFLEQLQKIIAVHQPRCRVVHNTSQYRVKILGVKRVAKN